MNCQKCRTPLKLDSSLQDLNPAAFDLLAPLAIQSTRSPPPREFRILKSAKISTTRYLKMLPLQSLSGLSPLPVQGSGLKLQRLHRQRQG
ncbi:hypothetical protein ABVK25_003781 [Lepraria finkii]|uniref:Uncharacterized protein n=1 Tax=Lepraria finkii TaxID=1340010 RepID=A0ABR4BJM8_9LECA